MGKEKKKTLAIFGCDDSTFKDGAYQITHHSFVNLLDLFAGLVGWLDAHKYVFYENKITEKDIGTGHEVESAYTGWREVNFYIKFHMSILIHARDIREVTLEDGTKTYWARTIINYASWIEKNHSGRFKSTERGEMLRQLYDRYVIRDELSAFEGKLFYESVDLVNEIKSHLRSV
jgi:hypothetical protein